MTETRIRAVTSTNKWRFNMKTILTAIFFILSATYASASVTGYKDFKFGMTHGQALKATEKKCETAYDNGAGIICSDGYVLFGERRRIFIGGQRKKVEFVRVDIDYSDEVFGKLLGILNKKYKPEAAPGDNEYAEYNKMINCIDMQSGLCLPVDLRFIYDKGHVELKIEYNAMLKQSLLRLIYRNKRIAQLVYKKVEKARQLQAVKTTQDDF